jgi:hypothetical protein
VLPPHWLPPGPYLQIDANWTFSNEVLGNGYPKLSKTQWLNQHQGPFFFKKKKNRGQAKSRWFTTKAIPKYAMSYMVWYMVTISQITNEICLYRGSITWCRA